MTPEEACSYLDISLDDDLDVNQLEQNYKAKFSEYNLAKFMPGTPEYKNALNMLNNLEEAYNLLLELYAELYEPENVQHKNEGLLIKMAVIMAGVFLASFGAVVFFVYRLHTESIPPKIEPSQNIDYERVLRELEQIRTKQEETPAPQVIINNPPADYASLVEQVMPSIVFIQTNKGTGSGFFVSSGGDNSHKSSRHKGGRIYFCYCSGRKNS